MDRIAAELKFDLAAYNKYMDAKDNFDKVEQSAMSWRSKVDSGM